MSELHSRKQNNVPIWYWANRGASFSRQVGCERCNCFVVIVYYGCDSITEIHIICKAMKDMIKAMLRYMAAGDDRRKLSRVVTCSLINTISAPESFNKISKVPRGIIEGEETVGNRSFRENRREQLLRLSISEWKSFQEKKIEVLILVSQICCQYFYLIITLPFTLLYPRCLKMRL